MSLRLHALLVVFLLVCVTGFSQTKPDPKWSDKYYDEQWKGTDLVALMDSVKFKPFLIKTDTRTFKSLLLRLSPQAYRQMNIDSWYLCSTKHDDYFALWNLYYAKLTKITWDQYCKGLMMLMIVDGMAKSPKG